MKKSLVALAALVATGAFAQSSVEIYGTLDVGLNKVKNGLIGMNNSNYAVPVSQSGTGLANTFARSSLTTNNIGFRGTEDLGGGLRAGFNLQTGGLDLSTGAAALAFSREANLSLTGAFGTVKLGRSVSTMCTVGCSYDYNYISNGSAYAVVGVSPANIKASSRRSNQIEWTTPTVLPGLTLRAATILRGDAVEDSTFSSTLGSANAALTYKGVGVLGANYVAGPLRAAIAYEGAASNDSTKRGARFAGFDYDFGMAKVALSYVINDTKGNTASTIGTTSFRSAAGATSGKGWGFSVAAPLGAATLGVQYADNTENKVKATEVFARYTLSKRTELYGYYTTTSGSLAGNETAFNTTATTIPTSATSVNINNLGLAAVPAKVNIMGVGVRHTF
jgi:predicted porin